MPVITDYPIFWEYIVVISNFYFLLPIITSFYVRLRFYGFLFFVTWVMSSYYHLCATSDGICIVEMQILQSWDHVYSGTMLVVLAFQITYFLFRMPRHLEIGIVVLSFFVIFASVKIKGMYGTFGVVHYVLLAVAFLSIVVLIIVRSIREQRMYSKFDLGRHFVGSSNLLRSA